MEILKYFGNKITSYIIEHIDMTLQANLQSLKIIDENGKERVIS